MTNIMFDFMGAFVTLAVGSVFFAIGANFILYHLTFKAIAKVVTGRVKAIEKYTSTYRSSDGTQTTTYYRPIVEYLYKGETHTVNGASINQIRHKLKQQVTVLLNISEDGTQHKAMVKDPVNMVVGAVFMLMGLMGIGMYIFAVEGPWLVALIVVPTVTGLGHVISTMMLTFKDTVIKDINEGEPRERENSVIIDTKSEYLKEIAVHDFWGTVIALVFMAGSVGILYFGYNELPQEAIDMAFNNPKELWDKTINGDLPSSWEKAMMICGIGLFFFLASVHSVLYVRRTYGSMNRM